MYLASTIALGSTEIIKIYMILFWVPKRETGAEVLNSVEQTTTLAILQFVSNLGDV